jgi:hypothetical protein
MRRTTAAEHSEHHADRTQFVADELLCVLAENSVPDSADE